MAYNYQAYVPSAQVNEYKRKQDNATNIYNAYAQAGYSQGAGGLGAQVNSAQSKLNALYRGNNLSQQFRYGNQAQYDAALKNITERKPFEYDLSNDMLFQQAKEQYQAMGKTAMADTIGQASAMTGGYGNSYAATAGNQAYQAHLRELNNSIGDYYAMALNNYNNETDRLNGVFNALSADRGTQQNEWSANWNVYNNLYNMYQNEYSDMLGKDMSAWQQRGSNLYNAANLATSQYGTAYGNDINIWNNQESLKATQAQQLETERANRADEAYKQAALAETIRSNQASEKYNYAALAVKAAKSSNSSGSAVNKKGRQYSKSEMIDMIDRRIQDVRYKSYNGDYESAKQKVVNDILRAYFNNGIDSSTANKILDYYNMT